MVMLKLQREGGPLAVLLAELLQRVKVEGTTIEHGPAGPRGMRGQTGPQGLRGEKGEKGDRGEIGPPGPVGRPGINGQPGKPGKDGSPDSPKAIKLKLESLSGDERLDAKAIKNLEAYIAKLPNLPNIEFGGGSHTLLEVLDDTGVVGRSVRKLIFTGGNAAYRQGDETVVVPVGSGSGSGGDNFIDNETPAGTINGSNVTFTLANTPESGSVKVFLNGMRQTLTEDYTISGATITFVSAPPSGSILRADYRTGTSTGSYADAETPAGTINGLNTSFTLANTPVSDSSVFVFLNGQRQTKNEDYTISGSIITFITAPLTGSILRVDYRY